MIDEEGIMLSVVGYFIVFTALVVLYLVFSSVPKILALIMNAPKPKLKKAAVEGTTDEKPKKLTGEVNAAISTALFLYFNEQHDEEDPIITIEKTSRTYSPWSSKIYSVHRRDLPNYHLPSV